MHRRGSRRLLPCVWPLVLPRRHYTTPPPPSPPGSGDSYSSSRHRDEDTLVQLHINRMHPLHNSTGQISAFRTACGRLFDPALHAEVMQASAQSSWLSAIARELQADREYVDYVRAHGGVADTLQLLETQSGDDDDGYMEALYARMKTDFALSLSLCACVDAYTRIRQQRDAHEIERVAAGRTDPYADLRNMRSGGGGGGGDV